MCILFIRPFKVNVGECAASLIHISVGKKNILFSSLLSKNIELKLYRTRILPVCMGVKLGLPHGGRNVG